jgi:hypothetical protein
VALEIPDLWESITFGLLHQEMGQAKLPLLFRTSKLVAISFGSYGGGRRSARGKHKRGTSQHLPKLVIESLVRVWRHRSICDGVQAAPIQTKTSNNVQTNNIISALLFVVTARNRGVQYFQHFQGAKLLLNQCSSFHLHVVDGWLESIRAMVGTFNDSHRILDSGKQAYRLI